MPLKKGKKNVGSNIKELEQGAIGPAREKAIRTLAAERGITFEAARAIQAQAIALRLAGKSKKK